MSGVVPWTVLAGQLHSMLLCCRLLRRCFQLSYDDSTSSRSYNSNSKNAAVGKSERPILLSEDYNPQMDFDSRSVGTQGGGAGAAEEERLEG